MTKCQFYKQCEKRMQDALPGFKKPDIKEKPR